MAPDPETPMSFSDFPEDVQLNVLSFLCPAEISAFARTCRRFAVLCSPSPPYTDLWLALCDRRWGSKTRLRRWSATPSPCLYKTLERWEHLIGFWRRFGDDIPGTPLLVFFEWSPSCIIGSRISPSPFATSYGVRKIPFIWLGISPCGETCYLHSENPLFDSDVIPVTISFPECDYFVVEESSTFYYADPHIDESAEVLGLEAGSLPDGVMSEIYQYFANRTSPGPPGEYFANRTSPGPPLADKSSTRQWIKEKKRLGERGWEAEHFLKIPNDLCRGYGRGFLRK